MNKLIPIAVCCVWPLIVHAAITYGTRYIVTHDWKNIQWQNIKAPWSKDQ